MRFRSYPLLWRRRVVAKVSDWKFKIVLVGVANRKIGAVKFDFIFIKNRLHRIPPRRFALGFGCSEITLLKIGQVFAREEGFFFFFSSFLSIALSTPAERIFRLS